MNIINVQVPSCWSYLKIACVTLLTGALLIGAGSASSRAANDGTTLNGLLGRGVNLGNALDAPREGAWGVTLRQEYFQAVKDAGFNSVRIPIQWSAHAEPDFPYTIDPIFFARVDWAIDQALSRGLTAVIDVHHYADMDRDPVTNAPRLIGLWKQIADHYKRRSSRLFFELFNEPQDKFGDQRWNELIPTLLQSIRQTNPTRMVVIGPGYWNSFNHLPYLQLPEADRRIVASFHYYKPFHFTHQAQNWLPGSDAWKGTKWDSARDNDALLQDFDFVAAWAREHHRPVYLGEFDDSENADPESRIAWVTSVAHEAERRGFTWSYWQFCSSFGIYDPATHKWNHAMLRAFLDKKAP